jgi:hypothetical protein
MHVSKYVTRPKCMYVCMYVCVLLRILDVYGDSVFCRDSNGRHRFHSFTPGLLFEMDQESLYDANDAMQVSLFNIACMYLCMYVCQQDLRICMHVCTHMKSLYV